MTARPFMPCPLSPSFVYEERRKAARAAELIAAGAAWVTPWTAAPSRGCQ